MMKLSLLMPTVFLAAIAAAQPTFTAQELEAHYPEDLGAADINVSAYPKDIQDGYAVFVKTCSQCHSTARAVNSEISSESDWRRYIKRMKVRTKVHPVAAINSEDAKKVLEFLVYDSNKRKIEGKTNFAAERARLVARYAEVRNERKRRQIEADKAKARQAP